MFGSSSCWQPFWFASRVACLVFPWPKMAKVNLESVVMPIRSWFPLLGGSQRAMRVLDIFGVGFVWFFVCFFSLSFSGVF